MTALDTAALDLALDALPHRYPGPGGVAGVVKDGVVIAARAWGHADLEAGTPLTATMRLPICSISKQFTCGVLLAEYGEALDQVDGGLRAMLPDYCDPLPTLRQLADNQSGLRDYWALTVLHGAMAEQTFGRGDALPLIARMKTGHFPPGTSYSYCNANFRLLSELIEGATGTPIEALYRRHIWEPAGMDGAALTADTRSPADGVVGYEGAPGIGYLPAHNGIFWIGDAGISASLHDMLAYERWIDTGRDDPAHLYQRLSAVPHFSDGTRAWYGLGLAHVMLGDLAVTGHGGALRGFRSFRCHAAAARMSVVVMLNHEGDAQSAALSLMRAALSRPEDTAPPVAEGWEGAWIAPETGLLARVESGRRRANLSYATGADRLRQIDDETLGSAAVTLRRTGDSLRMTRAGENASLDLQPLTVVQTASPDDLVGRHWCDEVEAEMEIEARGGGVRARFTGMLGTGRWERMAPVSRDLWRVTTERSMDAAAPGDWTLAVQRDAAGAVTGFVLGCWLARGLSYRPMAPQAA